MIVRMNKEKGLTFIIVTHNMEVAEMTHKIISIRDGLVEKEQILHKLDSFTNEPKIASPPMPVQPQTRTPIL